jgi:hypothetical protein
MFSATGPHGLCAACWLDLRTARDFARRGAPVPDDVRGTLKIQEATLGFQLLMADSDLHWQALGKPFMQEAAAENAGRAVLAALKIRS